MCVNQGVLSLSIDPSDRGCHICLLFLEREVEVLVPSITASELQRFVTQTILFEALCKQKNQYEPYSYKCHFVNLMYNN